MDKAVLGGVSNSLWPSDAIWGHTTRHRSGSTLAQVMACCLAAPSHYLTQCWLIIRESSDHQLRAISQEIPQPSVTKVSLKISYLKLCLNLPGHNELRLCRETVRVSKVACDLSWIPRLLKLFVSFLGSIFGFTKAHVRCTISCNETCQIWMWWLTVEWYFDNSEGPVTYPGYQGFPTYCQSTWEVNSWSILCL